MPSALDIRYDEVMAQVLGPGGRLEAAPDSEGRLYVTTLPGTLPGFFDAFCALMCEVVAVVAGNERLTFAALNAAANDAARALIANHSVKKGDRVGIAMRNAPAWIVVYMAVVKAGGIATLLNGWWKAGELAHALRLTEPACGRAVRSGDMVLPGHLPLRICGPSVSTCPGEGEDADGCCRPVGWAHRVGCTALRSSRGPMMNREAVAA